MNILSQIAKKITSAVDKSYQKLLPTFISLQACAVEGIETIKGLFNGSAFGVSSIRSGLNAGIATAKGFSHVGKGTLNNLAAAKAKYYDNNHAAALAATHSAKKNFSNAREELVEGFNAGAEATSFGLDSAIHFASAAGHSLSMAYYGIESAYNSLKLAVEGVQIVGQGIYEAGALAAPYVKSGTSAASHGWRVVRGSRGIFCEMHL